MWYCCTARGIKLSALHTLVMMTNLLAECSDLKVKVNFTLKQVMKAESGRRDIALLFLSPWR
jgi:hypothetical protein